MRLFIYASLAVFLMACSANQSELTSSESENSQNATAMTEQSPLDQASEPASSDGAIEQQESTAESINSDVIVEANSQAGLDEQPASGEPMDAPVEQEAGTIQDSNNMDIVTEKKEKSDSKS